VTLAALPLLLQVVNPQEPSPNDAFFWFLSSDLLFTIVKILVIFVGYLSTVAILTLMERKVAAWMQDRHGPNRTGPGGILQPAADGLKNFMKEEVVPTAANKPLHTLAPAMAFIPALLTFAVIPFAAPLPTRWGLVPIQIADIPVGFLFILAIASLGVYGIVLAGWSSNNKYALLGGLRSSAQMVSYEISLGMSTVPVLLLAGNVTLGAIVAEQARSGWNAFNLTIAFFVFIVASFAETNRLPFDLPESESELVAGYHTEYSSMKFAMFFLSEYAGLITASAMMTTLFLGGWGIPFTHWDDAGTYSAWKTVATFIVFGVKTFFFIFLFMWVRWTVPRFRYDQLMSLGWKFMLPLILSYVVVVAGASLALDALGVRRDSWLFPALMFAMNVVLVGLVFGLVDRGRLLSPASARTRADEIARLRQESRRSALAKRYAAEAGD
jgi:NADH-quinone oxidoreductase subunit H